MSKSVTSRAVSAAIVAVVAGLLGCKAGKTSVSAVEAARLSEPRSETTSLRGLYSYLADAGLFFDCATGQRWPVATAGDNEALERAYLQQRSAPGAPVVVTLLGRLETRPEIDGPGQEVALFVTRFLGAWPGQSCEDMAAIPLEDTRWELLELNGTPIVVPAGSEPPYLELSSKKASAYGFGGCNRFFGSYRSTAKTLELGALGATRMACPDSEDREQELFRALGTVTGYEVRGTELVLLAGDQPVARFQATSGR